MARSKGLKKRSAAASVAYQRQRDESEEGSDDSEDYSDESLNSDDSSDEEGPPHLTHTSTVLFGAELNALQREHRLSYHGLDESRDSSTAEALIDPDTVESSRYFLHQLVLGRDARKDERNVLEVEASNIEGDLIRFPVACLKLGQQEMASLDLEFDVHEPVTLYLSEGSGPLTVIGKQQITYSIVRDDDGEENDGYYYYDDIAEVSDEDISDEESDEVSDEISEEEEEEEDEQPITKKRKRSPEVKTKKSKSKKSKLKPGETEATEVEDSGDDDEEEEDEESSGGDNEIELSDQDLRLLLKQKKLQQQQQMTKNGALAKKKPVKRLKSPKFSLQESKAKARAKMNKIGAKYKAGK